VRRALLFTAVIALLGSPPALAKRRVNGPGGHTWPPSRAMKSVGASCLERLTTLGVEWKRARRRRQIATPVVVPSMTFGQIKVTPKWRKGPFVMDCHLAEALAMASEEWFALGVRELRFSSIHDYRNVRLRGSELDRLSRHALGLAIDVYEVVDAGGLVHVVDDHYWSLDLFLPAIELKANQVGEFRTVLSPLRDPSSHGDHFHLEAEVSYPKARARSHRRRSGKRRHRSRHRRRHRDSSLQSSR